MGFPSIQCVWPTQKMSGVETSVTQSYSDFPAPGPGHAPFVASSQYSRQSLLVSQSMSLSKTQLERSMLRGTCVRRPSRGRRGTGRPSDFRSPTISRSSQGCVPHAPRGDPRPNQGDRSLAATTRWELPTAQPPRDHSGRGRLRHLRMRSLRFRRTFHHLLRRHPFQSRSRPPRSSHLPDHNPVEQRWLRLKSS